MQTRRFLVGGPPNSCKSTFILSTIEHLRGRGISAEAVELDLWSNSYPAFRGEVSFAERPKRFDLRWNWKPPLDRRIRRVLESDAEIVIADMPGKLGEACAHMCRSLAGRIEGAIVISCSVHGMKDWAAFFDDYDIPVVRRCISVQGELPFVFRDLRRRIDGDHDDVIAFADDLFGSCAKTA